MTKIETFATALVLLALVPLAVQQVDGMRRALTFPQ